ncbi:nuclear transport factor 2 family protein [Pseudonocardia sp.]|uniref:nuclear transport factor 2 family protein n=1 Tax=Pseudonocardia sp. TaxID=60912 RepID=UPI0026312D7D|nr:nuclear transport factor 2 family protein [Pseudonocardia sp.]
MTDTDLVRAVRAYVAAWNTADDGARRRLLAESFAEDGCYLDPSAAVVGREALIAHTRAFGQRWPGAVIELTSGIDEHSGSACFTWRVRGPGGETLHEGLDVVSADTDGRLCQVIGFFGGYRSPHLALSL